MMTHVNDNQTPFIKYLDGLLVIFPLSDAKREGVYGIRHCEIISCFSLIL